MDKNYLECLEHIIEIEKTSFTQQKLIEALEKKIASLGLPRTIKAPEKIETYVPRIEYNLEYEGFDSDRISSAAAIGCVMSGIIGFLYGCSSSEGLIGGLFNGVINGVIFLIIGSVIGAIIGFIISASKQASAKSNNKQAQEYAQSESNRLYNEQLRQNDEKYKKELAKYQAVVEFDNNRVIAEKEQKKELFFSKEEVIKKYNETQQLLEQFYDYADIYETYRNVVAVCYIYEYLKSGISKELTGHEGAYLVFKYEMYEKLKIEKLDTIISKLDQIHFDNITLNNTMQQIENRVDNLISEVSDLKISQIEATERNEKLVRSLGNSIDAAANRISHQNAILAYNEECTTNELKQIKWLSLMNK